ncbi:MAG: hypothetical protein ABL957_08760 [Parvularculaceae bacterium]
MTSFLARKNRAGLIAAIAFAIFGVTSAEAAGTNAGTSVSNTFTLDYQVGGVNQTQVTNSGSPTLFTVDRLVDLTVTSQGDTSVVPGAVAQTLVWSVRNDGNDRQAYSLALADFAPDDFDIAFGSLTMLSFVDDGDGVFEPGAGDGAGTAYTQGSGAASSDILPDRILWVRISGTIPGGATNTQRDEITLVADSLNPVTSLDTAYTGTPGAQTNAAVVANNMTGEAQNVLADNAGVNDAAADGAHSDNGAYVVATSALTASKAVNVIATDGSAIACATDPVQAGNQYASPGACIEYVISAANAVGAAASATNINISDVLPNTIQYVGVTQSGFTAAGTLTPPAGGSGCVAACTITLTGATLNPGATGLVTIRALVR